LANTADDGARRALALLAASLEGLTESLLVYAHQVPVEVLVELIESGYARVRVERLGRPAVEVTHVEITDAGREAMGSSLEDLGEHRR
jgi:hypothetical protein